MAKQPQTTIEENEDGSLAVDLKPYRKFKGSDADPIDADTGDSVFDDLNPRFSRKLDEAVAKEADADAEENEDAGEEAVEDEEVVEELATEDEAADEESETDEVDEEPKPKKKDAFSKRLERADRLLAEQRSETAALRERLNKQESDARVNADEQKYTSSKAKLQVDLTEARKALSAAIEAGDTAAQVDANEKLTDIKGDMKVLDVQHTDAKLAMEASKGQRTDSSIVKTKSAAWIRKHNRFNSDKEFSETAKAVDAQVAAAGFDAETDEYYKELDKRMSKFYPKEFKLAAKLNQEPPARRKPPVSGMRREEGGKTVVKQKSGPFAVKGGKVILTARNIKTMQDFGLDPRNANDVRDFVEQNRTQG